MELALSNYKLQFSGLGTPESVSSMRIENIKESANRNLIANKTDFVVSGNVSPDHVASLLTKIDLPQGQDVPSPEVLPQKSKRRFIHEVNAGDQSDIIIGFRCDTTSLEEVVGLMLVRQLCSGRNNPFINILRYERGLIYSGTTQLWNFSNTSILGIRTSCESQNIQEVFDVMVSIIHTAQQNGLTETQFETLKAKTEGYYRFALQTSREWLDAEVNAIRHIHQSNENFCALDILSYLSKVSTTSFNDLLKKFFSPNDAYCAIVGSPSTQAIQHIEKSFA
jgi:predicted Zn-dependent peptidase